MMQQLEEDPSKTTLKGRIRMILSSICTSAILLHSCKTTMTIHRCSTGLALSIHQPWSNGYRIKIILTTFCSCNSLFLSSKLSTCLRQLTLLECLSTIKGGITATIKTSRWWWQLKITKNDLRSSSRTRKCKTYELKEQSLWNAKESPAGLGFRCKCYKKIYHSRTSFSFKWRPSSLPKALTKE